MEIIILSSSLATLDADHCETSSELFELGLALALSEHVSVRVFSMRATPRLRLGNLDLIGLGTSGSLLRRLRYAMRELGPGKDGQRRLLMYGYDPVSIAALKYAAMGNGGKIVNFVFDHHAVAIEHKGPLRRFLIDLYFRMGLRALRHVNGLLLLNQRAHQRLQLKHVPYLVSRVGVARSPHPTEPYSRRSSTGFKIVYAGSLESCNAVVPLLEATRHIPDRDVTLDIVGSGWLSPQVEAFATDDKRITYHGRVSKARVDRIIRDADLLVNLRDLDHSVADYSFPSKLIVYMASGIPVLSSRVIDGPEFEGLVNVVSELDSLSLAEAIVRAKNNPEDQVTRASRAQCYVEKHHQWPAIADEVLDFLASI